MLTAQASWLDGPTGERSAGAGLYQAYAEEHGLKAIVDDNAGLLPDLDDLAGEGFDPARVRPEIRDFYERTARYNLTVQIGWSGPFRYPPRTLIYLVGRNAKQFNIPLSSAGTEVLMKNELIRLADPTTDETSYVGWLRRSAATGEEMLAGFYAACELPEVSGRFFKGVYPLPGGSATTIFRPINRPEGSLALISNGWRFGGPGYYRIHRTGVGTLRVKCVPMDESLHVFVDPEGTLRAHHTFAFAKFRFLSLGYKITLRETG